MTPQVHQRCELQTKLVLFVAIVCTVAVGQIAGYYGRPTSRLEEVINKAAWLFNNEENLMKHRFNKGIDKLVPDFETAEPGILEAVNRPLDNITESLGHPSRVINWIKAVARQRNVQASISTILSTDLARRLSLTCPFIKPTDCSVKERYRRVDGSCNNLAQPLWGAGFTPMARQLPAQYETGVINGIMRKDMPRSKGVNGGPLPSARVISNNVHESSNRLPENAVTMAFVFFGQQTAHDVTDTAFERGEREQLNMVSSFIDASNMYGHTEEVLTELRGEEGQLESSEPDQLPLQMHPNRKASEKGFNFLNAGDERVGEVTGLTAVTTVWQREHNRIARQLAKFPRFASMSNKKARNDAIFYETRKLVIAIKQHITYNEFLRLTVGPERMNKYKISPLTSGYFTGYDSSVNPTLSNVMVVAAHRFGHSLLRSVLSVRTEQYTSSSDVLLLKNVFWRPSNYLMYENGFQRGVVTDPAEMCDRHIIPDVRNHLFETAHGNGEDLVARNVARGRDHGVPSYNAYRTLMGLSSASTFTTNSTNGFPDIPFEVVRKLREIYSSPGDVDVFTGGISETPVGGGVIGPLFAELMALQYEKLRVGDRFWYENQEHGFSPAQLAEIRKVTMSRLMCDNVAGVTQIQPRAFLIPTSSGANDRVSCDQIPSLDLSKWQ
ncbi:peroxidasin-like [Liolophura sinensis]|uniref:peroxidasin-like n=1 Tax=Liolophura sinensis TaxID=3198878 RepID=UPI003158F431